MFISLQKKHSSRAVGGFTAFEALIAVTILAIIATAVSGALSAGRQQARAANEMLQARMHAEALLAEILLLAPNTTPANTVTSRGGRNDLLAYNNYSDGPANIQTIAGVNYPTDMQGYVRKVTVTRLGSMTLKRITLPSPYVITITISRDDRTLLSQSRLVPG